MPHEHDTAQATETATQAPRAWPECRRWRCRPCPKPARPVVFASPVAAVDYRRAALGLEGPAQPEDAWRLAALFVDRLELGEELPRGFGFCLYFRCGKAAILIPSPEKASPEERERMLLHELGHFLLTWGNRNNRMTLICAEDAGDPRRVWRVTRGHSRAEARANAFRDLWLTSGGRAG